MTIGQSYNVALAFPWNNECFEEIIRNVAAGLRELGYQATEVKRFLPNTVNIVIGFYINQGNVPPRGSILYQLEPYSPLTVACGHIPVNFMRGYKVWEYSRHNIAMLKQNYGINAIYAPAGRSSALYAIPEAIQDIDVLFYGGIHPRRKIIIEDLRRRGLNVVTSIHAYREDLAKLIARAKVVLNLHGENDYKTQESWRLIYPLTFGKAVVTEANPGDDMDGFSAAALCVPYQNLVDACFYLVHNDERRHEREIAGREYMNSRPISEGLRQALEDTYGCK